MCEVATALAVAQGGLSLIGRQSEINAQNAAAAQNRANSIAAMNVEQAQNTEQYLEEQRSLIQGGFDAILKGREDEATAYASAVQSGVTGSSVRAVLRDSRQRSGRSQSRFEDERRSLRTQTQRRQKGAQVTARSRINSVPTTGFNFGDLGVALAPILRDQMG